MRITAEQYMDDSETGFKSGTSSNFQWMVIFDGEASYKFQGTNCVIRTKDSTIAMSAAAGPIRITRIAS